VVVFLQGDRGHVLVVDADVLRFRITRRDLGQAGQVDVPRAPARRLALEVDDAQKACGQLRDQPVVEVLVALVLDRHCGIATPRADGDGIRLAAHGQRGDASGLRRVANVEHRQHAIGLGEAERGIHRDQRVVAMYGHRGRFAFQLDKARRLRRFRIANVHQTDALARAVGVDQCAAVAAHRGDLGDGLPGGILIATQVAKEREGRDPLEVVRGAQWCRLRGQRQQGQGQGSGQYGAGQAGRSSHAGLGGQCGDSQNTLGPDCYAAVTARRSSITGGDAGGIGSALPARWLSPPLAGGCPCRLNPRPAPLRTAPAAGRPGPRRM